MSEEKVYKLQTEVAVINSKLDEIMKSQQRMVEWTARHEAEHKRMLDEHDDIRGELRSNNAATSKRIGVLEREYTAFSSRQNVINAILGFLAGTAVTIIGTMVFGS